ncbi:MAG: ABC transporter ATP-binding protein [Pseudomonadota bacterium]
MGVNVLELTDITKRFGSLTANDSISLSLAKGEVLALLGENGAGKTTLMNILFGHYVADEGAIKVRGEVLPPGSPEAAIKAGIGMVHQHFTLADNLTVLENVILGRESLWRWRQDLGHGRQRLGELSEQFGLGIDPDALVGNLSVGQRQRVEILKALYADAHILILDEPTAVLTPQETDSLFATLRSLVAQGRSAIIISHKLHEILRVSDRVAVLRRGQVVGQVPTAHANRDQLAEMMVGRSVVRPQAEALSPGQNLLSLSAVQTNSRTGPLVGMDMELRAHEILGIAGVAGNGQTALAQLLSGTIAPSAGRMALLGQEIKQADPRAMVSLGVGRIPEDRQHSGVVGEMAIWENLVSEEIRQSGFSGKLGFLKKSAAKKHAEHLIDRFDVRCQGPEAETRLLSGGNMQKLILARSLSREPRIILASQPSRGLDEGAIAYVHGQLLEARKRGAGIILISEDLDELMALSDRIAVFYRGKILATLAVHEFDTKKIGLMMSGQAAA